MAEDFSQEEWLGLPWARGYEASSAGRIRSYWKRGGFGLAEKPVLLRPRTNSQGYLFCIIRIDGIPTYRTVHSLVAVAFSGIRPEGMECRHLDGIKSNCNASNLKWGTRQENCRDKDRHGTKPTKLKRDDVVKIRELSESGVRQAELARRFGVTSRAIHCIITRRHWAHVV